MLYHLWPTAHQKKYNTYYETWNATSYGGYPVAVAKPNCHQPTPQEIPLYVSTRFVQRYSVGRTALLTRLHVLLLPYSPFFNLLRYMPVTHILSSPTPPFTFPIPEFEESPNPPVILTDSPKKYRLLRGTSAVELDWHFGRSNVDDHSRSLPTIIFPYIYVSY
ncbi:hypothetical protein Salat_1961100 [Sesamum alatum]|uniref:Uncharacterized protein n=1 Tax=Sesamum alatum TaxID=300844 RepID=A0AAE2CIV4_9LAMI|nr:hypothetical protein Salat_1961100 [Sesamum alatum]